MERRKFIRNATAAGLALSFAPFSCAPKLDAEIIILGGGISGLYLAHLLDEAGKDYILLEGSDRLGGRMFYREDLKRDVGGRGIGDKYTHVMSLVDKFGVDMIDITPYMNNPRSIYLGGKLYPSWEDLPTNPALLEFMGLKEVEKLGSLDAWYQRPDLDIPYHDFLKSHGKTEKELELINISANYNDIRETSSINSYHSRAFRQFNGSKKVLNFKGGTGSLIKPLAASLTSPAQLNKMATSIEESGNSIKIGCEDGSSYTAKKAVSTLPFTTLRKLKLDLPLSPNQEKAINGLNYTLITQIHLTAKEAYWEEDGAPMSMWTDTPLERIMDVDPDPETLDLVCWVNGKGTGFFDEMSDQEIADFTLKQIAGMRPAAEGKIEYVGTHKWGKYRYNEGAYVEFAPGQAAWFEDMIKPAGNLHFAGEHAARKSRGMEGAAESAYRVFQELTIKS
ncbi:MAG: NAD(P)/FAD-dependent oxidoreductase [Bacteroidota bacterium]